MVTNETLRRLDQLARELAQAGRLEDVAALTEAAAALRTGDPRWVPIAEAAERLNFPIPMVLGCVERGALTGQRVGGDWYVSRIDIDEMNERRAALWALEGEGNPTDEEIQAMYERRRQRRRDTA